MGTGERIALWTLVIVSFVGLIVAVVVAAGELDEVNRQLLTLSAGDLPATEGELQLGGASFGTPAPASSETSSWGGQAAQVGIAGVTVLSDTVTMTVTVQAYGAGDLLFEPPVLESDEGRAYPMTGDSLEMARLTFLDLVTKGQATARFEFSGRLSPTAGLWLVFNPNQEPANAVAPPLRVPVPVRQ
jgi:hypothetical protein